LSGDDMTTLGIFLLVRMCYVKKAKNHGEVYKIKGQEGKECEKD